jgi:transposase-like protein
MTICPNCKNDDLLPIACGTYPAKARFRCTLCGESFTVYQRTAWNQTLGEAAEYSRREKENENP